MEDITLTAGEAAALGRARTRIKARFDNGRDTGIALRAIDTVKAELLHQHNLERQGGAPKRQYGDRAACKWCGTDIEFHGRDYGWSDRGGNYSCNDGKHKHAPERDGS